MTFFARRSRAMAGISVLAVLIAVGGAPTAALAASTTWSTPANLSTTGQDAFSPQVTVDGSGLATAVWYRWDGVNYIVQASFFDNRVPVAPPVLAATGVDTAAVALTSIFALLVMVAGIGMIHIRRTQATPTMITSSQQRQHRRNH